ncbi:MAG: ribbon-helix-helix domain-containing protein [Nanoarchaeota archaeon]|nr:ribbon-helix-helix domain-containing protein [Nanoarchaeota archaeon]
MKIRLSITVDEEKAKMITEVLKEGLFRSRSHVMEYALIKFLKEKENEIK